MQSDVCNLCGDHGAVDRDGRLGRYHFTCDSCENKRGTHLAKTSSGYANAARLAEQNIRERSPMRSRTSPLRG